MSSKSEIATGPSSDVDKTSRTHFWHRITRSLLYALLPYLILFNVLPRLQFSRLPDQSFDWDKVTPTPYLKWHSCGKRRECARLEVPLDHANPHGEKAAIGLLRIPSKTKMNYRGPVLINPGGPGGSGVLFVNLIGDILQELIGDDFDVVGFDPRGVSSTTPKVVGFSDDIERAYWNAGAPSLSNNTPESFELAFARSQLESELILSRMGQHVLENVGTATVARDMVKIVDAFGQDKLNYWGFSYGTVLGGTFAAMFPEKVGRVVLDGVVDFADYYSGDWLTNLMDTDKELSYIYAECVKAGDECPLYGETPSRVEKRLQDGLRSLKLKPVTAFDGINHGIVDYGTAKKLLFISLYAPFAVVKSLFEAFAWLEKGDPTALARLANGLRVLPTCTPVPTIAPAGVLEGSRAVGCTDSYCNGKCKNVTVESLKDHLEEVRKLSIFADVWIDATVMTCPGWSVSAKEQYNGDFNATTSFPMLIIGNTLDPVTPLSAAKKAANAFSNSVLLTIDTPGHCSIAATSPLAMKYIRNYFREGVLPPENTVCPIVDKMFMKTKSSSAKWWIGNYQDIQWLDLVTRFTRSVQDYHLKYRQLL